MTPDFAIVANDEDITATLRSRLLQLRISDEAGLQSDTCELALDDRDFRLQWPVHGAELQVSLGYRGQLDRLGRYIVDEVAHSGPPNTLTIRAKAADMIAGLKAAKTREWPQQSLGVLVAHIAAEHQLRPRVSDNLNRMVLPHMDQTDESDLHLLTRLAKQYDAVAKPANGFLLFVNRGEVQSVSGRDLSTVTIQPNQILQHRMTQADRGRYQSVRSYWHDTDTATRISVLTGEGEPVYTLRASYPDATQASNAAEAKLQRLQRGEATLSLTVIGNPSLQAEGQINIQGLRAPINGLWLLQRVNHQLDANQGFTTQVEAVVPNR